MTAETFALRDYQQDTVSGLYASYGRGNRRVATVLPTGGGKTVVFSHVAADAVRAGRRSLVLAHRTELIDAAEEKLLGSSAGMSVGVVQGRRREFDRDVIVGSVQTIVREGALNVLRSRDLGLVVVDECHHIAAATYQTILRELGVFTDAGPLLYGVTATLGRGDRKSLGDTFEDVAHAVPMTDLIRDGHLLRPKGLRVKVEGLDLSRVKRSRTSESGLDDRAVAAAMSESLAPAALARAILKHGKGRHGVAFLPTVELSKEQARVFNEHGINAIHVDADTPRAARKEIIRRARLGEYDMVCNVGLFTEGTDVPIWDLVALARMTSSDVLFQQMAGRGLRPYPGQSDCLVMDFVGLTARLHIRTVVELEGVEMIDELDDELKAFDEEIPEPERDEPGHAPPAEPGIDGELVSELVDLFGASHVAWQHSPRGVWYLPGGNGYAVFLAPADEVDRYDVYEHVDGAPRLLHEDPCDISAAMAWGEKAVRERAARDVSRDAGWRRGKVKRADRLTAVFRGLATPDELTGAGALVDARDRAWAGSVIDVLPSVADVTPSGYWVAT